MNTVPEFHPVADFMKLLGTAVNRYGRRYLFMLRAISMAQIRVVSLRPENSLIMAVATYILNIL